MQLMLLRARVCQPQAAAPFVALVVQASCGRHPCAVPCSGSPATATCGFGSMRSCACEWWRQRALQALWTTQPPRQRRSWRLQCRLTHPPLQMPLQQVEFLVQQQPQTPLLPLVRRPWRWRVRLRHAVAQLACLLAVGPAEEWLPLESVLTTMVATMAAWRAAAALRATMMRAVALQMAPAEAAAGCRLDRCAAAWLPPSSELRATRRPAPLAPRRALLSVTRLHLQRRRSGRARTRCGSASWGRMLSQSELKRAASPGATSEPDSKGKM